MLRLLENGFERLKQKSNQVKIMSYVNHPELEEITSEWVEMSTEELIALFGYNEVDNSIPEEVFPSIAPEDIDFNIEPTPRLESNETVQPLCEDTETEEKADEAATTHPIHADESIPPVPPLSLSRSLSSAVLPFE